MSVSIEELEEASGGDRAGLTAEFITEELKADANAAYDQREETLGAEVMRELERRVVLSVLDRKWREHLYEMDYLQEGIGLRAMAQRDPLVEYQREGFNMFAAMMDAIKEESVGYVFNLEVQVEDEAGTTMPRAASTTTRSSPRVSRHRSVRRRCSTPRRPWTGTRAGSSGQRWPAQRWPRRPWSRTGRRLRRRAAQRAVPLRVGQEVQALPRRPPQPQHLTRTSRGIAAPARTCMFRSRPPQPSSRAVHCHRPSMPSSRSATAVERAPRRTRAQTSATPSAGSLTCSERTTPRGGPSTSEPRAASTRR